METSRDRAKRPIANPIVVLREESALWAVLFNPETADALDISPVGTAIWKLMDGRRDVPHIAAEVRRRFAGVPEATDSEVQAFIDVLAGQGLVGYEMETQQ